MIVTRGTRAADRRARLDVRALGWAAPVVALLACGGPEARLEPRYVAVHNAFAALGLAQTGPITGGSLERRADARVVVPLSGEGCTVFVALGSGGVRDLDLLVLDESGETIARDASTDRQAAAQVCPGRAGEYAVVVRMAEGEGEYTLAAWSAGSAVGAAAAGGGMAGTCGRPTPLPLGRPVRGTTRGGGRTLSGGCAQGNAAEHVYRVDVAERALLSAVLDSSFDGVLYLRSGCAEGPEMACNDDSPPDDTRRSEVRATVEPGSYYLVVDGFGEEEGDFQLLASLASLRSVGAVCEDAPAIAPGQAVSGDTTASADYFQATCAGGARSPDYVYQLEVRQRSRLRIRQQSDHDGALHVRATCAEPTSELVCNDDFTSPQRSLVRSVVDAGTYYVVSDGFGEAAAGPFSFTAELEDADGTGVPGDACGDASGFGGGGALGPSDAPVVVEMDTFRARDDLAGSCGGQGAPDVVYAFDVRARSLFRARVEEPELSTALYVRRACDDAAAEVTCSSGPELRALLRPGRYHLVADGAGAGEFGAARLSVALDDAAPFERACRAATPLRTGVDVTGDTRGAASLFGASCAGEAASAENLYRLVLRRRSQVRLELSTPDHDGVLHLRRDCIDPATEVVCNDDHDDNRHSRVDQVLDAGTYVVFVDGFQTDSAGTYTLRATVSDAP